MVIASAAVHHAALVSRDACAVVLGVATQRHIVRARNSNAHRWSAVEPDGGAIAEKLAHVEGGTVCGVACRAPSLTWCPTKGRRATLEHNPWRVRDSTRHRGTYGVRSRQSTVTPASACVCTARVASLALHQAQLVSFDTSAIVVQQATCRKVTCAWLRITHRGRTFKLHRISRGIIITAPHCHGNARVAASTWQVAC